MARLDAQFVIGSTTVQTVVTKFTSVEYQSLPHADSPFGLSRQQVTLHLEQQPGLAEFLTQALESGNPISGYLSTPRSLNKIPFSLYLLTLNLNIDTNESVIVCESMIEGSTPQFEPLNPEIPHHLIQSVLQKRTINNQLNAVSLKVE